MKVWGIIAAILLVVAIGFGGWLYVQNKDLKSQKSKVEADLTTASAGKTTAETKLSAATAKMVSANKKIGLLKSILAGIDSQDQSLVTYEVVKSINDPTLNADWQAMQNSKPGDNTGTKMMDDLLTSATNDLK